MAMRRVEEKPMVQLDSFTEGKAVAFESGDMSPHFPVPERIEERRNHADASFTLHLDKVPPPNHPARGSLPLAPYRVYKVRRNQATRFFLWIARATPLILG